MLTLRRAFKGPPNFVIIIHNDLAQIKSDMSRLDQALTARNCNGGSGRTAQCVSVFDPAINKYSS